MDTKSKWEEATIKASQSLKKSNHYDVAVIGGGITGIVAAYLLTRDGYKVCVLEREKLGGVDTSRTTAHLTYVTDIRFHKLVKHFGQEKARMVWQAGKEAIDLIESIVQKEVLECEFKRVPGYLFTSMISGKPADAQLKDDYELAREAGFNVKLDSSIPYFGKEGIHFDNQALFHPLKFISGLIEIIKSKGCDVFEQTEVNSFEKGQFTLKAGDYTINAENVIIATHVPLTGTRGLLPAALFQTKLSPYSSYVLGAVMPKGSFPEASYWDLNDPYYYLRIDRKEDADYLIFGGEDHKTGQVEDTEACYHRLEEHLKVIAPDAKITHRWSGQVIETNDGLPYIGEVSSGQFVATGFSGNGTTFGTLSALMAKDAIVGAENKYKELFDPGRFKLRGGLSDYIKENIDYPYYLIKDRIFSKGETDGELNPGEGKIIDYKGDKLACYRGDNGRVNCLSAVCTHMGGIVHWNSAEKTWDCPCHGSRFHTNGEVLTGPAETPLAEAEIEGESATPLQAVNIATAGGQCHLSSELSDRN